MIGHVGDSRIYHIGLFCRCLTDDQSLVAHELSEGLITRREARRDKRINVLLECIGASDVVHPFFYTGKYVEGKYCFARMVFGISYRSLATNIFQKNMASKFNKAK